MKQTTNQRATAFNNDPRYDGGIGHNGAPERLAGTVQQSANALGVSVATIWKWIRDQSLETVCLGRKRLVLWPSLINLLESRRGVPGDARRNQTVPALGAKLLPDEPHPARRGRPPKDARLSRTESVAAVSAGASVKDRRRGAARPRSRAR
jgi:hypothetical protein